MKVVLEIKLPVSVPVLAAVGDALAKIHIGKVLFMQREAQMLKFFYEDISDCFQPPTSGQ